MSSDAERAKDDDWPIGCVVMIVFAVLVWWLGYRAGPALAASDADCEQRGGVLVWTVELLHYACVAVLP